MLLIGGSLRWSTGEDRPGLLLIDELLGQRDGLLRAGAGIAYEQLDLAAQHAADWFSFSTNISTSWLRGPRKGRPGR
jgi:hypothetical protein